MHSSLRERFARAGQIRDVALVPFGLPATFVLRLPSKRGDVETVSGARLLARRGLSLLRAKRAMEELLDTGCSVVELPRLEDEAVLAAELAAAGIAGAVVNVSERVDVRGLRQRLGLTREQFSARYGLELETVRNWEAGRREPDSTARSYLRAIANDPERVEQAYAPTPRPMSL